MVDFEDHYCAVPRFFLTLAMINPLRSNLFIRFGLFVYTTLNLSVIIPQLLFIIHHGSEEFDYVVENVGAICYNLMGVAIFITVYVKRSKFKAVHFGAVDLWERITDDKEREICTEFIEIARLIGIFFSVYFMFGSSLVVPSIPILCTFLDDYLGEGDGQYKFPLFHADYIFFKQQDHFWISWIHIIASLTLETFLLAGIVGIFVLYIRQICALFDVLRLTNYVGSQSDKQGKPRNFHRTANQAGLDRVIILHNQVLEHCARLEESSNALLLIVELCCGLVISVLYYYTAYATDAPPFKRYSCPVVAVGTNFAVFCLNWMGQGVKNYSEQIFDSAYSSEWELMTPKERKTILLIMNRSLQPFVLTAGTVLPLSMESFGKITKTTFSYMAAIASMR